MKTVSTNKVSDVTAWKIVAKGLPKQFTDMNIKSNIAIQITYNNKISPVLWMN